MKAIMPACLRHAARGVVVAMLCSISLAGDQTVAPLKLTVTRGGAKDELTLTAAPNGGIAELQVIRTADGKTVTEDLKMVGQRGPVKAGPVTTKKLTQSQELQCPPSPVIKEIRWAPAETVLRKAKGSDNWPMTWGDDDFLYTAYGDGNGFEPFLKEKLSLGLARIAGDPPGVRGENLRAASLEQKGDGARGKKASGLLMVDGVLYLWARNANNAQLAWSADRGGTWTWSGWQLAPSFGCPTFLNFGRNYGGARDEFVYIYSHDSDSAYERADRMVLARVAKDRIRRREAYDFFERLDSSGRPVWHKDIARRGPVMTNPGRCYRSNVSYSAGLRRCVWVQTGPGVDPRFAGGLAIYDAPEPWGPWTVAFTTEAWDVGPGETASLPPKWMSPDGRTVYLVFSGNDCFSVRRGELVLHSDRAGVEKRPAVGNALRGVPCIRVGRPWDGTKGSVKSRPVTRAACIPVLFRASWCRTVVRSPEGAEYESPGQRPGEEADRNKRRSPVRATCAPQEAPMSPFQGSVLCPISLPRALPWAFISRPFGAKNAATRRLVWNKTRVRTTAFSHRFVTRPPPDPSYSSARDAPACRRGRRHATPIPHLARQNPSPQNNDANGVTPPQPAQTPS